MNIKEWCKACDEGWAPRKYDNASREIQLSLKYNPNPKATVRHHLMDTNEQIEYNTNHYEMWGFNLDGTFEYGKYMIFVTEEEHHKIHCTCDDTNKKRSLAMSNLWSTSEFRDKITAAINTDEVKSKISEASIKMWENDKIRSQIISAIKTLWTTDEYKQKQHYAQLGKHCKEHNGMYGRCGEDHPFYGHHLSEEHKKAISEAQKSRYRTYTEREKISESLKNSNKHPWRGCKMPEEHVKHKKEIMDTVKRLYYLYKNKHGSLDWNNFQRSLRLYKQEHKHFVESEFIEYLLKE
jgi:hypothetical protein